MHHPMPFGKVPVSCCRTFLWHLPGARMQAGAPAGRLPSTLSFANVGNIWEYNSPMSKLSTIYKQQNLLAAFLGWNVESILPPLARLTRAWLATHSPGKVINTSCYDSYNCSHKAAATIEFSPLRTCCFACSLNFLCVCEFLCIVPPETVVPKDSNGHIAKQPRTSKSRIKSRCVCKNPWTVGHLLLLVELSWVFVVPWRQQTTESWVIG